MQTYTAGKFRPDLRPVPSPAPAKVTWFMLNTLMDATPLALLLLITLLLLAGGGELGFRLGR